MNTKLLLSLLGAGLVIPVAAVYHSSTIKSDLSVLNSREDAAIVNMSRSNSTTFCKPSEAPSQKIIAAMGEGISSIEDYGELTLLLEEDFSKLTYGSFDAPEKKLSLEIKQTDPEFTYPWWNFKPQYTHVEHWGIGGGAYAAGECLFFNCLENERGGVEGAKVNTPLVDLTPYDGMAVLEFKVRSHDEDNIYSGLWVEAAETYNMSPTWKISEDNGMIGNIPAEWTTYRLIFQGLGKSSLFNIVGEGPGQLYIDDIKVYGLKAHVGVPTMKNHTEYTGTSFVANWTAIDGADEYLFTCYSLDPETGTPVYVLKDFPCDENRSLVEGVESGEDYYCYVKSVKGEHVSVPSWEYWLYDLEAPKFSKVNRESEWVYNAEWSEVPSADVYNYWAYCDRVAEQDGLFYVTNENFDGITDAEGNLTGWEMFDINARSYAKHYPAVMKQQGWYGTNISPLTDCIGLDAWYWYSSNEEDQTLLESPNLDLSKDGGKFTISVKLAGEINEFTDYDGIDHRIETDAVFALFNYNEETGEYEQAERVDLKHLGMELKEHKVEFTKGTENSIIGIFAQGYGFLCIDDLQITQNYKKDEFLREPYFIDIFHGRDGSDPTFITVEVPLHATGYELHHKVSAVKSLVDPWGNITKQKESAFSDTEHLFSTISDVPTIRLKSGSARVEGDVLIVSNPEGESVNVYAINGTTLYSGSQKEVSMPLPAAGVYIVKIGNCTYKVNY